jgi:hypothetical protein
MNLLVRIFAAQNALNWFKFNRPRYCGVLPVSRLGLKMLAFYERTV